LLTELYYLPNIVIAETYTKSDILIWLYGVILNCYQSDVGDNVDY
jgi:hypothetical protein